MQSARKSIERDLEFTQVDFASIREFAKEHTGISLASNRKDLVYGRLSKRVRALGLTSFSDYIALLGDARNGELENFTNAMTTNLTAFFRESHHFDYLSETLLPSLMKGYSDRRRIRIWSAGCSTGEEPYSIAMTLLESNPGIAARDVKILATDLDSDVLSTGKRGIYSASRVQDLGSERVSKWFLRGTGGNLDMVKVSADLQKLISFRRLNLMESWPFSGQMDAVFCRNVIIYFDKDTQQKILDRFADAIVDGGIMFIGHSESMHNLSDRFELIGKTVYRKVR